MPREKVGLEGGLGICRRRIYARPPWGRCGEWWELGVTAPSHSFQALKFGAIISVKIYYLNSRGVGAAATVGHLQSEAKGFSIRG